MIKFLCSSSLTSVFLLLLIRHPCSGQTERLHSYVIPTQAAEESPGKPQAPTINQWRLNPISLSNQIDDVAPDLRAKRDMYWDRRFPRPANGAGIVYSHGSYIAPAAPDVPREFTLKNTDGEWAIATFESYRVFETSSKGGLYTEISLRVHHVFETTAKSTLEEGRIADIAIRGGSIIEPSGKTRTFLIDDPEPLPQPGHSYLLQLTRCSSSESCEGQFYILGRSWDLTSGTAQPVDPFDVRVAKAGLSSIAGQPASSVTAILQNILSRLNGKVAQ